jgi:hypothetical protein
MTLPKDPIKAQAYIKAVGDFHRGKKMSDTSRKKMSDSKMGEKNPMFGKHFTPEARRNASLAQSGSKSFSWRGGVSFEPYCVKFDRAFKKRVRDFFNNTCLQCGKSNFKYKLHVHHVNFNKQTCCDNSIPLFAPLCNTCHGKTHHNRIFWQYWFTEMINHLYGGKCYFEKDEVY